MEEVVERCDLTHKFAGMRTISFAGVSMQTGEEFTYKRLYRKGGGKAMRKLLYISRIMVGVLCLILGGYAYIWWDTILMESGGTDQGGGILMVVPNFLAMVLVVFGLVLLIQGMIRFLRKASSDR